ncbi:ABC transporter ATP-binding protein [Rubritalea tangerina]|uniref:ABC transporter ATP-binding protein n=1 Tax=Rubritalea tangerina TaxID=430798 RepID=A0ABW4ZAE1_9BACT
METLHFNDIYKSYPTKHGEPFLVLDNIDLTIHKGEFCTLVGPSGCGKSTLLKLILGQDFATSGQLTIKSTPVGHPDSTRGVVYQKYSLYPNKTVLQNVLMGPYFKIPFWKKQERQNAKDYAIELLTKVKLEKHLNKYPHELSGGMQQRVAIIQALITQPEILLMDEPFGALDPGTREFMQTLLIELWEKYQLTILFVTHDLEEACFLGTRLLVLSQYYTDDRGADFQRGAKFVVDRPLHKEPTSTHIKETAEFAELVESIRHQGFNPAHLQHVTEFDLSHPQSWSTLNSQENNSSH